MSKWNSGRFETQTVRLVDAPFYYSTTATIPGEYSGYIFKCGTLVIRKLNGHK